MKKFNPSPTLITGQFQDLHLIWIWIITLKIFFHLNNPSFIHLEWCSISPNQNGDRQMQEKMNATQKTTDDISCLSPVLFKTHSTNTVSGFERTF